MCGKIIDVNKVMNECDNNALSCPALTKINIPQV